jgi:glycosyltransferase involved in cell wall biosynthesis
MSKIVFYCHDDRSSLEKFEYYKQDLDALKSLGHQVIICTKYREIPLKYDAIFIWWWTHALYPVVLSKILRKPSIITGTYNFRFPEGFNGRDYFQRPNWQKYLLRVATKLCTLNLFVSQLELTGCSKHFNLTNAKYYPHVIHNDYLKGPSANRKLSLFNLAWSSKENMIRKGIPELLSAIRQLKDEGVEVELNLAGLVGDGVDYLLKLITDLNISNEVNYLGMLSRESKIEMLRNCEIYVQPSHYEGFGVAVAEAMGSGACAIVCDVGAVKEVVGDSGYYVSPGSSDELANAISLLLKDESLRNNLQKKSYQRIKEYFTSDKKKVRLRQYLSELGIS